MNIDAREALLHFEATVTDVRTYPRHLSISVKGEGWEAHLPAPLSGELISRLLTVCGQPPNEHLALCIGAVVYVVRTKLVDFPNVPLVWPIVAIRSPTNAVACVELLQRRGGGLTHALTQ